MWPWLLQGLGRRSGMTTSLGSRLVCPLQRREWRPFSGPAESERGGRRAAPCSVRCSARPLGLRPQFLSDTPSPGAPSLPVLPAVPKGLIRTVSASFSLLFRRREFSEDCTPPCSRVFVDSFRRRSPRTLTAAWGWAWGWRWGWGARPARTWTSCGRGQRAWGVLAGAAGHVCLRLTIPQTCREIPQTTLIFASQSIHKGKLYHPAVHGKGAPELKWSPPPVQGQTGHSSRHQDKQRGRRGGQGCPRGPALATYLPGQSI